MARRKSREARASNRRDEAAIKLMVLGGGFVLIPFFLGKSPMLVALASLRPLGLLMLAAGGLIFWLNRRAKVSSEQTTAPTARTSPPIRLGNANPAPVARTVTERQRSAAPPQNVDSAPAKPTTWSAAVFDVIEWRRFEALVEALFQQGGFETKSQSHGADGGVDIWLHSRNQPGKPVSIVQCKHWSGKKVGVDKMRELRGVMASFDIARGQYATSSTYTADAITFARENGINPLDANGLLALITKRTPEQQQALLDVALEGDYQRPTCVNCGTKMVSRSPRTGGKDFWGCANYPKCRTNMPMRGV